MSITSYQAFQREELGIFVFPFLSKKERKNLGQVDKTWHKAMLEFEIQGYRELKVKIRKKNAIYLIDVTGVTQEKLLGELGSGGCKKAIKLMGGRALIVPNMDVDPMPIVVGRWKRMVCEEVAMSELLTNIGLLTPLSKQVNISLSQDSEEELIPAYLSESFESLGKTKGWSIIDTKNGQSSTWKQEKNFLFPSEEDRLNEKNWDSVVDSVLTDIATICIYGIPTHRDSLNLAVLKKPSESAVSQFEVRYFGFDFSDKEKSLAIPTPQRTTPAVNDGKRLLDAILNEVFHAEFGRKYTFGKKREQLRNFKDQLVEKYSKEVVVRMQQLTES